MKRKSNPLALDLDVKSKLELWACKCEWMGISLGNL